MKPLFFGDENAPLFGIYHPPRKSRGRTRAIVLCYPILHEYLKAHRAFRLLADQLARAGAHVWRFDYFGTGDSVGESSEGSVEAYLSSLETAIRELKALSSLPDVSLVGLRFGASLAAVVAAKDPSVETLMLWDPVCRGASYVDQLRAIANNEADDAGSGEDLTVVGCPLTAELMDQIGQLELSDHLDRFSKRLLGVVSEIGGLDELREGPDGAPRFAALEVIPDERSWGSPDQEQLIPAQVLKWMTTRLMES